MSNRCIISTMNSSSSDHPTDGQAAVGGADRSDRSNIMKTKSSSSKDDCSKKGDDALHQRSDKTTKKRKKNQRNNQNNDKPKRRRRRRSRPSQRQRAPPHIMPEARLVQDLSSGYAFISDSESSDDDDNSNGGMACSCCRNIQESKERHTRKFTPRTHPHFFH